MNIIAAKPKFTPEDLLTMRDGDRFELVDGKLVEKPMSTWSSFIGGLVYHLLIDYCLKHKVGWAWPADLTYRCFPFAPERLRKPDVSFIRQARLTHGHVFSGYCPIAPDLAVEILSPNDLASEIEEKIEEYQRAGVRLIWIVNPDLRTVRIHRLDGTISGLHEQDLLSGEDVITGFQVRVADLFPPADMMPPAPPAASETSGT
jgi:Uma2 family endonuclease